MNIVVITSHEPDTRRPGAKIRASEANTTDVWSLVLPGILSSPMRVPVIASKTMTRTARPETATRRPFGKHDCPQGCLRMGGRNVEAAGKLARASSIDRRGDRSAVRQ